MISAPCSEHSVITQLQAALGLYLLFPTAHAEKKNCSLCDRAYNRFRIQYVITIIVTMTECWPTVALWAIRMCSLHSNVK